MDQAQGPATTPMSIFDLNVEKSSETPFEFEFIDEATGKGKGFFVSIIGEHAPAVQEWTRKRLNELRTVAAMAAKRGKDVPVTRVEEDQEFGIGQLAVRVVAWRGVKEPFTPENAFALCKFNPSFRSQVKKASEELANFTPNSSTG